MTDSPPRRATGPTGHGPSLPIRARIGVIGPLKLIDTTPYEFYRVAGGDVMFAATGLGLRAFTTESAQEAFNGLEAALREVRLRAVDMVMLNGIPMLVGLEPAQIAAFREQAGTFAPRGGWTAIDASVAAIAVAGAASVAVASKWSDDMNSRFVAALGAKGVNVVGSLGTASGMQEILGDYEHGASAAWDLVHATKERYPSASMIFLAGAAWLTLHLLEDLEDSVQVPVVTGLQSTNWFALNMVGAFEPRSGQGSLLTKKMSDQDLIAKSRAFG